MSIQLDGLRLTGASMEVGTDDRTILCPWCQKEKGSFVLRRFPGTVYYQCYRASCGRRGIIQLDVDLQPHRYEKKSRVKRFTRPTYELPSDVLFELLTKYQMSASDLKQYRVGMSEAVDKDGNRYPALHIPVRGGHAQVMAHWLKTWPKVPHLKNDLIVESEQFNGLFIADAIPAPVRSTYAIIVEDPISAIKASAIAFPGIALLGTDIHYDMIAAIKRVSQKVILALDPGTEHKMASLLQKYGGYFREWHNIYLPDDLKRVPFRELEEYLKPWRN